MEKEKIGNLEVTRDEKGEIKNYTLRVNKGVFTAEEIAKALQNKDDQPSMTIFTKSKAFIEFAQMVSDSGLYLRLNSGAFIQVVEGDPKMPENMDGQRVNCVVHDAEAVVKLILIVTPDEFDVFIALPKDLTIQVDWIQKLLSIRV